MRRLFRAARASPADLYSLFRELKAVISLHDHVEQTVFYRAAEQLDALKPWVERAREEHAEIKAMLEAMEQDDELRNRFDPLAARVEAHIAREEDELFPRVRESGLDLEQIAGQLDEERINYREWAGRRVEKAR